MNNLENYKEEDVFILTHAVDIMESSQKEHGMFLNIQIINKKSIKNMTRAKEKFIL